MKAVGSAGTGVAKFGGHSNINNYMDMSTRTTTKSTTTSNTTKTTTAVDNNIRAKWEVNLSSTPL